MKLLTSNEKILSSLEKMDIKDTYDLIETLPYRYENYSYSDEESLNDKDKVTLLIKLVSDAKLIHTPKIDIIKFFFISVNTGSFYNAVIYNRAFYKNMLNLNDSFTMQGIYNKSKNEFSIINLYKGEIEQEKTFKPCYHLPSSLTRANFVSLLKRSFEAVKDIYSFDVPEYFQKKYRLLTRIEALKKVHFPTSQEDISQGIRTLKYAECLEFNLKNAIIRHDNNRLVEGKNKIPDLKKINEFISSLTYKLTSDQIKAIRDIVLDMNKDTLMYRLLEGDVGTGKTIVAITCLYANYLRKNVGAFMVPTDTLARQQYEELKKLLEPFSLRIGLLIGSMSIKEKQLIKEKLLKGEIDVMCGTHALFSEDVIYPTLGLCIIDEQHRFGVNQRSALVSKGELCDLLLMSATPIPRTLSIALYGDLDISTLNMYPVEKNIVETYVVEPKSAMIFQVINDTLAENRQVFILAPKIENSDNVSSVEGLTKLFSSIYEDQVLTLTGKIKSEQKEEILNQFKNKEKKILISTTVVELGLNVLDAGAMIIFSASHFGLATLHQLRGRVGRNGKHAYCLLIDEEMDRLKIMERIHDGAELAFEDLKNRGGGDLLGAKQSGFSTFKMVNIIDDNKMFLCAKEDAYYIINHLDEKGFENYILKIKDRMYKEEQKIILFES